MNLPNRDLVITFKEGGLARQRGGSCRKVLLVLRVSLVLGLLTGNLLLLRFLPLLG
jgi:hypothetical protein